MKRAIARLLISTPSRCAFSITAAVATSLTAWSQELPFLRIEAPADSVTWGMSVASGCDVNADGIDDIFAMDPYWINGEGDRLGRLYMYSGKTGEILWSQQGEDVGGMSDGSFGKFIHDVNADDRCDLIIGHPWWPDSNLGDPGAFEIRSGRTGELLDRREGNEQTVEFGKEAHLLNDFDDDQIPEIGIVVRYAAEDGYVHILSGKTLGVLHQIGPIPYPRRIRPIDDLDGDDISDFLIASVGNFGGGSTDRISAFSGATGDQIWTTPHPYTGYQMMVVDDLNDDDVPDIVARYDFAISLVTVSGKDGQVLSVYEPIPTPYAGRSVYDAAYANVLGDASREAIFGNAYVAYVYAPSVNRVMRVQSIPYPVVDFYFNGNALATGNLNGDQYADIIAAGSRNDGDPPFVIEAYPGLPLALELVYTERSTPRTRRDLDDYGGFVITVYGATPGEIVHFLYSFVGAEGTYLPQFDISIELSRPIVKFASKTANADGLAWFSFRQDENPIYEPIWIQAVQLDHDAGPFVRSQAIPLNQD